MLVKKATIVLFILNIFIVNIFIFNTISSYQVTDLLFNDTQKVVIDYQKAEKKFNNKDFVDDLNQFSKNNQVNITQYNFVSDDSLNIYSTNPSIKSFVHLKNGDFPKGNSFISNKEDSLSKGVFDIFSSVWNIKIYNFNEVKNVGLKDELYLHNFDDQTLNLFNKSFVKYGELNFEKSKLEIVKLINIPLLMVTIFSFFIYSMVFFASIIKRRHELNLYVLFGLSHLKIVKILMKQIFKSSIYFYASIICITIVSLNILEKEYILKQYYNLIFVLNIFFLLSMYSISIFSIMWTLRMQFNFQKSNSKYFFEKLKVGSIAFKLILLVSLLGLVCVSLERYETLNTRLEGMRYWNKTQNVYRVQVGVLNNEVLNDLRINKDYNDRMNLFYNSIKKHNNAFLINSDKFNIINYKNDKPIYNYMMDIKKPIDIYSPQGRSIVIDSNYLKLNPIWDKDNTIIDNQIKHKQNVLNIIVPHQYKKYENEVIKKYLDWFFFQSVTVSNIYNKELQIPINKQEKKDLNINIIYSKMNQNYFTFNNYTGDSKNNIIDPIAIIYTDTLDNSNIGAFATSSLFYLDSSKGKAFENIYQSLKSSNVKEVNSVISIYDEANTQITSLKWELLQQIIGSLILVLFSLILFIGYVWSYYYAQIYQLTINYLFGYSYLKNNKQIIIVSIILNVTATILVYLVLNMNVVFLFSTVFIAVEMCTLYFVGKNLMKNNVLKIIKGEI